jgi:hypothetical protein
MNKQTSVASVGYIDIVDRKWFLRLFEILPGLITWVFLLSPVILSILQPIVVAYFIIAFDLVWLVKSLRLSFYLVFGYSKLRAYQDINWLERLSDLDHLDDAITRDQQVLDTLVRRQGHLPRWWHLSGNGIRHYQKYRLRVVYLRELQELAEKRKLLLSPATIYNAVIIATYKESLEILEPSIVALLDSRYPLDRLMLVIAYEERGGIETKNNAKYLIDKYGSRFAFAQAIEHPDGIQGEARGKGANISFAGRRLAEELDRKKVDPTNVIITTFDSDHRAHPSYFSYLTYAYAINPNRTFKSFQPVPMFFNNIWDVPAPMRIIATGNSFWMIMEAMRPHRLRNFAAHAQSLQTLLDTDFWSVTSIVEDGHQFWRTYFTYDGNHEVVPLFIPVYQDAVLAKTYPQTLRVQYLQLQRWAWGVSDISYVVSQSIKNRQIGLGKKLVQLWRLFEGHFSWATAPLILTFVAWLPLYLNNRFADELIAHQLPIIASRILNVAMIGLFITVVISLISLPPRPPRYRRSKIVWMVAQWLLLPLTAIIFSAFAAIDSQTRLMLGLYLDFRVTDKSTKESKR